MLQGCGLLGAGRVELLPKSSLIEKTDGESQYRMVSLGEGVPRKEINSQPGLLGKTGRRGNSDLEDGLEPGM